MIFTAWCVCCAMSAAAQDCEISLTIAKAAQKEELPSQVQEILGNRLAAAVAAQGGVANSNFTPFFITAKANTLYKETLSGPPVSSIDFVYRRCSRAESIFYSHCGCKRSRY